MANFRETRRDREMKLTLTLPSRVEAGVGQGQRNTYDLFTRYLFIKTLNAAPPTFCSLAFYFLIQDIEVSSAQESLNHSRIAAFRVQD